jgi:hypothetical protein
MIVTEFRTYVLVGAKGLPYSDLLGGCTVGPLCTRRKYHGILSGIEQ